MSGLKAGIVTWKELFIGKTGAYTNGGNLKQCGFNLLLLTSTDESESRIDACESYDVLLRRKGIQWRTLFLPGIFLVKAWLFHCDQFAQLFPNMTLDFPACCIGLKYCKYFTCDRHGTNLVSLRLLPLYNAPLIIISCSGDSMPLITHKKTTVALLGYDSAVMLQV